VLARVRNADDVATERAASTTAAPAAVRAPLPGRVVQVLAAVGAKVAAGAPLVVMEAMKMENELRAPGPGTVIEIRVRPGQAVEAGEELVRLGPG
jgi:3-methylcrotonyl-CoA carboxylase alpha subunit